MSLLAIIAVSAYAVFRCSRIAERLFEEITETVKVI